MAVALLLLLPLSQNSYAETVYLDNSYHAAQLNWLDRSKRLVDKTDPIREEQTAGSLILNTAGDHDITFKQKDSDEQVRVINGTISEESGYDDLNYGINGFYVRQYFDSLLDVGVAAIYKKDADGNLQKTDLREVEWIDAGYKDGEFQDLDVTGSGSEYRYLLGQPVIAYYKLNMVTAQQGTMNFNDEVKWDFKQAKGSQLFVAEDNAHINVKENANIDVDFGEQHHVLPPNLETKREEELGTTKVWNKDANLTTLQQNSTGSFGAFYARDLDALRDTIRNSDKEDAQKAELYALVDKLESNYAALEGGIDSAAKANSAKEVIEINQQLGAASILGSFNNTAKEKYIKTLEKEVITRIDGDYVAVVEEKNFNDTTHYINEAMKSQEVNTLFISGNQSEVAFEQGSQVKVRNGSILKADNSKVTIKDGSNLTITGGTECENSCGSIVIISGNDAVLTIEEGANLKVDKGLVVNASNGAKVTNNTAIELNNGGSNANIVNAAYTQNGDLYFNMTANDQKTAGAVGDNVSGKLSTYTNLNNIYSTGLSASSGLAGATITARNGATVTNQGNIHIAALSKGTNNLSDGVLLQRDSLNDNTLTFINEADGLITVGYYKDENGELTKVNSVSGTPQSLMDLRYRAGYINNAILVNGVKGSTSKIVVDQKGTIMLGNFASGINFNQSYDDNSTVNNSGKIYVDGGEGSNTLVLKATATSNNVETNPKSHYIFARPADSETAQTIKNIEQINGNYTANGGAIFMNTVLNAGHEATLTDKLIVDGDVTVMDGADSTKLYISNAQGKGAYTGRQPDAIEVVSVGGKSDNNSFILGNKVAIGIYEYTLHKGSGENAESWYLDSYSKDFNPGLDVFMGNKETALGMFTMSLEDRMGNLDFTDPTSISNNNDYLNSAWVRIVADQTKFKAFNKSMSIKSQSYIVHLGMDVYNWTNEHDATRRVGVMAGYGYADIKNRSSSGFSANGKIDQAYNVGLYGTYYNPNGFYIDGWVQHSWFKNKLSVGDASDSYRSRLWTVSLELGHNFNLTSPNNEGKQWRLQPQGQLMWHNYKMNDKVISSTGLAVTDLPGHTTVSRLGMKLIYANVDNSDRKIQPFVELNWYHSNINKAVEFNDWYTTSNSAPKNRYELKIGAEGQYNKNWTIWGNIAAQFGKDDYSNYRGTLGVKYDF